MIKFSITAALVAFAAFSAPAMASVVVYDAATSFNGTTNPAGPFSFGQFDGTTLTKFTNFSTCASGLSCLLSSTEGALGAYKNVSGAPVTAFGTVDVPTDALFLHPGPTLQSYVLFTAPSTGLYDLSFAFKLLSNSTITGTVVSAFFVNQGVVMSDGYRELTASEPSFGATVPLQLFSGQGLMFTIGNDGDYSFDSTQVAFSATTSVPEPATWALMIAGFGLVGLSMRRRTVVAA